MSIAPRSGHRLALVVSTLTHGGAEVQVKTLALALARRGWRTDLIVLREPEAFAVELATAGIPVHSLGVHSGASTPKALVRLVCLLRRIRPDVVHSHMRGANILARIARPFARPPVLVCTAHNLDENVSARGIGAKADLSYRLTDRFCDLTTNVSRAAVERYVKTRAAPAHRIRYVPNGIDLVRFAHDPGERKKMRAGLGLGDRPTVLAVGRFHPQKNHDLLVRAFAVALGRVPDAVLLLVGSGALEADVRRLVETLHVERSVRFLGVRDDVPALLNAADCYAMSSIYEGLPIVLLEAAAAGLPIVATAVGGNPEILLDGRSGFLVPSEDLPLFADRLVRVLTMTPAERTAFGAAGREHVIGAYDLGRVVEQWESIYRELLDRVAPGGEGKR